MKSYTLGKPQRLKSKKSIEKLFSSGRHYTAPLLMAKLHVVKGDQVIKFAVVVPKKKFKRAVDRNLLKRRMREAYRLNNHDFISFLQSRNICIEVIFIYHSFDILETGKITDSIKTIFNQIQGSLTL